MISYSKFKLKWIKYLNPSITYPSDIINKLNFSINDKDFLTNVGFPKYCAPFLTFKSISDEGLLSLNEKFNLNDEYYNTFLYIGFNNENDILALENTSGKIKCIDFQTFEEFYVNKSVLAFAESLLEYFFFISRVNAYCGYLKKNCPPSELQRIKNTLYNIDRYALIKDTFWEEDLRKFYT